MSIQLQMYELLPQSRLRSQLLTMDPQLESGSWWVWLSGITCEAQTEDEDGQKTAYSYHSSHQYGGAWGGGGGLCAAASITRKREDLPTQDDIAAEERATTAEQRATTAEERAVTAEERAAYSEHRSHETERAAEEANRRAQETEQRAAEAERSLHIEDQPFWAVDREEIQFRRNPWEGRLGRGESCQV